MGSYTAGDRNVAQHTSQTVVATSDGTGTGQINDGVGHVLMGSNGGSANNIITLPSHSMGLIVYITTAATCELRVKTGDASKTMNGEAMTNSDGVQQAELALSANKFYKCHCISSTAWFVSMVNGNGTVSTPGTPD